MNGQLSTLSRQICAAVAVAAETSVPGSGFAAMNAMNALPQLKPSVGSEEEPSWACRHSEAWNHKSAPTVHIAKHSVLMQAEWLHCGGRGGHIPAVTPGTAWVELCVPVSSSLFLALKQRRSCTSLPSAFFNLQHTTVALQHSASA